MLQAAVDQGAEVLARLPAHVKPQLVRRLKDGSCLATIRPSARERRKQGECSAGPHSLSTRSPIRICRTAGESHRLLTTLLDPERYPALELVCAYHERWEIELVIDETDTHLRLADRPLRSLKPLGVLQELYALLIAHYAIRCLMHRGRRASRPRPRPLELHACPRHPASGHPGVPDDRPGAACPSSTLGCSTIWPPSLCLPDACAPTLGWSNARCPNSGSNVPNTSVGRSPPRTLSERPWPLSKRYCL